MWLDELASVAYFLAYLARFLTLLLFLCSAAARGDITFAEVPGQFGHGATYGAAWGDFDGDGDPDVFVSNHWVSLPSLYRNDGEQFTPVSRPFGGMVGTSDIHAAAWADFDNNGTQDLMLQVGANRGATPMQNWLFVNQDGVLSDEAVQRNLDLPEGRGRTPLWVDWDNDGRLDVILSNTGDPPTSLFVQETDGTFTASQSQPAAFNQGGQYASIIHLGDELEPSVMVDLDRLRINNSIFSLEGTSSRRIVSPWTNTPQDRVFADLNGDLFTDAVVTQNQPTRSDLVQTSTTSLAANMLMSEENPERQAVSFRSPHPVTITVSGMPARLIRAGGEGDALPWNASFTWTLDPNDWTGISEPATDEEGFYIGYEPSDQSWQFFTHSPETWYEVRVKLESDGPIEDVRNDGIVDERPFWNSSLLLWDDDGQAFVDATPGSGLDAGSACQSIVAEDFDNDTDLDLFMTCTGTVANAENMLFENLGGGSFQVVPLAGGAGGTSEGRSDVVASADYDLDGFVDLFIANGRGGLPFFDGVNQLFRNTTDNQNHWVEIDLVGVQSNRDGIGAKVVLEAGGVDQARTRSGGMHNRAQNFSRLHFGLGAADTINSLTIYWPSGVVQHLSDIAANQILTIIEPGESGSFDFNADGTVDVSDIDALVGEIVAGTSDPRFDLSSDGVVDNIDLDQWLTGAARANGFQNYLPGDTNLDGTVDQLDLNRLGQNWQQDVSTWSGGDLTADGFVNAADLSRLAVSWQRSSATAIAVPEPGPMGLLLSGLMWPVLRRYRLTRRPRAIM